ncbi:amino acid adenylation domain-containing protein [Streptomyces alboniger]|uniref:Non-ribosomal peptide synthetase n=1 Tax=Streptomyces alboniger TaxID=132473 RepID=A0A5J6HRM1_STRAD|nr:non-ribosomal peptide synthetase [Streptomyces alboniger]QEV21832.1 non-ribosomal peptide synthetase [Streptomyces alboniger]
MSTHQAGHAQAPTAALPRTAVAATPHQQQLYVAHELTPDHTDHELRLTVTFEGTTDTTRLRSAVAACVRRHDALRTRFTFEGTTLVQSVHSEPPSLWEQPDAAFDPERGPLLRAAVEPNGHTGLRLTLSLHRMVADERSLDLLLDDLLAAWQAQEGPGAVHLPASPAPQFTEYAATAADGSVAAAPDAEDPAPPRLPGILPGRAATHRLRFPAQALTGLRDLCAAAGAGLDDGLTALLALLVARYADTDDVLLATVRDERGTAFASAVGPFTTPLTSHADLTGDPDFRTVLGRLRHLAPRGAGADWPDEQPPLPVAFELRASHAAVRELPDGVVATRQDTPPPHPHALRLTVTPDGQARFDAAWPDWLTEQFARHYAQLLTEVVRSPCAPVHTLAVPAAGQTADAAPEVGEETVLDRFVRHAAERPDAVAVRHGREQLTYAELDRRSNRLARHLRQLGVGPEVLVGLSAERSPELVVAILGIQKAGGAYVPLDPAYPDARLSFIVRDTALTHVLVDGRPGGWLDGFTGSVVSLRNDAAAIAAHPAEAPDHRVHPNDLAYVIHTSGSTGEPKGTLIPHRNVARLFTSTAHWFGFGPDDVWTLFHSYAFDFSVWELWGALAHGGRLVVVPYEISRDPGALLRLLAAEGVTVLNQTPSAFAVLMREEERADVAVPALRYVVFGGEALEPRTLGPWFARHPDGPRLVNMYGITETTVHVTYRPISPRDAEEGTGSGSVIGVAIPDLVLDVLDHRGRPVPDGVTGELYVRGAGLARGYLGRPELTAARFVTLPGGRAYRTGDLVRRLPGGELEYRGRADDQMKIRGFRIEPGEVEAALVGHPDVREALVSAVDDGGGGGPRLVAHVVSERAGLGAAELRDHLLDALPPHMVPAAFVVLDSFPLTVNGKVDRRRLPAPSRAADAPVTASANRAEEILVQVWSEVLGHERVGTDENYFLLGGDSIRTIGLLSRARERGLDFRLQDLLRYQTIRDLAPHTSLVAPGSGGTRYRPLSLLTAEDRAALPADVEDAFPLSQLQAGMLYHSGLDAAERIYHNVCGYHIRAAWSEDAWRTAVDSMVADHQILRVSFHLEGFGEPLQLVHRRVTAPVSFEDLRQLDEAGRRAALDERFTAEKRTPFSWEQAPLIRFHVQRLTDHTFQLWVTEHHAILDGWSERSLITELFDRYLRCVDGPRTSEVVFPEPPAARFGAFVAEERAAVADEEHRAFWAEHLADCEFTALPRLRPATGRPDMRIVPVELPPHEASALTECAERLGVPMRTLLLAAHLRVVSLLTGSPDVVTGVVYNGRTEDRDGDRVLGMFLNTLPFRTQLTGGTWDDLVTAVHRTDIAVQPHRRFPMPEIKRAVGGRELFEAFFNFTRFHVYRSVLDRAAELEVLDERRVTNTSIPFGAEFSQDLASAAVRLHLRYDADRFTDEQVAEIGGYYRRTLTALATAPGDRYEHTVLLSEAELRRLDRWHGDPVPRDGNRLFPALLEDRARERPHAPAVVDGSATLGYAELNSRANRLARELLARGAGPGRVVALALPRSAELLVALVAVLKTGAAYLPVDPRYPRERIALLLTDARPTLLVTDAGTDRALPAADVPRLVLDEPATDRAGRPDGDVTDAERPRPLRPADPAYIIYTSGSTGMPKGVVVSHANMADLLAWLAGFLGTEGLTQVQATTSVSFDVSVFEIFGPLATGGTVRIHRDLLALAEEETLAAGPVTAPALVSGVPSVFADLIRRLDPAVTAGTVVLAGEQLGAAVANEIAAAFPGARVANIYGPSEAPVYATGWLGDGPFDQAPPVGRPSWNTRAYVLDQGLCPVPVAVPGELYLGGPGLAAGYLGRPSLTAERFVADPYGEPGARMYRTGDLVRWLPDGNLEFLGRLDDQVKINGFRIELGEVEAVLVRHPHVAQAAVAVREDRPGDRRLVGYVVLEPGAATDGPALRRHVEGTLPRHMVPMVVTLPALPRTPNGKLDRRALPAPDPGRAAGREERPPGTALEKELATLFGEVLGTDGPDGRLGAHDSFFDLGGHSLLAFRLLGLLRSRFGARFGIDTLFRVPTVAGLAALLDGPAPEVDPGGALDVLIPLRPHGGREPLFCFHPGVGLGWVYSGLLRHLDADRPVYGLQSRGLDDPAALIPDLTAMARDHVAQLRSVQPQGPYHLLGWSMGGILAHEAARLLRAEGEEVALLALLDSYPRRPDARPVDYDQPEALAEVLHSLGIRHPDGAPPLDPAAALRVLTEHGSPLGTLSSGQLASVAEVFTNNVNAQRRHDSRPVDVDVLFFEAMEGKAPDPEGPGDWAPYTSGRIESHPIACRHGDMLAPGPLADIAAVLARRLDGPDHTA